MDINSVYPSSYELLEVFTHIGDRTFLNSFAQSRGIFITNVNKEELSVELSHLFYDEDDIEFLRKRAFEIHSTQNLSGFIVKSHGKKDFSLKKIYDGLFENGVSIPGMKISELIAQNSDEDYDFKGVIEYSKSRPGKVALLQNEVHAFDFYLKELDDNNWRVEIDCGVSSDTAMLKKVLGKGIPSIDKEIEEIDQDLLRTEQTIAFFDELAKSGLDASEWKFAEVTNITIKQAKRSKSDTENNEKTDEEEDSVEIEESEVTGISQAILDGNQLREHPFVQDCVKNGYRFHSMTYKYESANQGLRVLIKAEFKGRPKVFEVGIAQVFRAEGLSAEWKPFSLKGLEHRKMRSVFWNNSRMTFNTVRLGNLKSEANKSAIAEKEPK